MPSTLRTLLRSFSLSHARQLDIKAESWARQSNTLSAYRRQLVLQLPYQLIYAMGVQGHR